MVAELPGSQALAAYAVVLDHYHYVRWFKHPAELYDLDADPQETTDLATVPAKAAVLRALSALAGRLAAQPADFPPEATVDSEVVGETPIDKGQQ